MLARKRFITTHQPRVEMREDWKTSPPPPRGGKSGVERAKHGRTLPTWFSIYPDSASSCAGVGTPLFLSMVRFKNQGFFFCTTATPHPPGAITFLDSIYE